MTAESDAPPDAPLDELYDARVVRRLDRATRPATPSAPVAPVAVGPRGGRGGGLRLRLAEGALIGALVGLADVLDEERPREPVIELAPDPGGESVRGVRLLFVAGQPEATVAVIG